MSKQLVESILDKDYVLAESYFHDRLNAILESKLYETKRMMQAEVFGGLSLAQIQARKELGWKKAADVWDDPRESRGKLSGETEFKKPVKKKKIIKKKIAEDISRAEVEAEKEKLRQQGRAYPTYPERKKPRKAAPAPTEPKADEGPKPKQKWTRRNLNTLLGRSPDYDPKDPKNQSRGGRAGAAVRAGTLGALSSLSSQFGS